MKLKNIIYAGLALLVFAGCSKDDDNGGSTDGKARLSVKLFASGTTMGGASVSTATGVAVTTTKGYTPDKNNELPGERNLNNLSILVFNENGTELMVDPYWGVPDLISGIYTVTNVEVPPVKAQIVFVANTDKGTFDDVNSFPEFEAKMAQLDKQRQDNLTMSSQVIATQKPLQTGDNYLGYSSMGDGNINGISSPIEVTRLAARLDLVNVRTNFTRAELVGRTVTVENIYVENQKTASRYFSPGYWGTVMLDGYLANSAPTTLNFVADRYTQLTEVPYVHYVMENKSETRGEVLVAPTQFVIRATLSETDLYKPETRTFIATINENGLQKGYDHNYVKRNYVYRITITFRDSNFEGDDEKPTYLDVQVQVAGWGPINQNVEI